MPAELPLSNKPMLPGWSTMVRRGAAFLAAYLVATLIGLRFLHPGLPVSPFWPAAGVAVAGVLVLGPWVALLIPVTELIVNAGGQPLWVSLVVGAANACEALLAAQIYRRITGSKRAPTTLTGLGAFTLANALGALPAAAIGVFALSVGRIAMAGSPGDLLVTWWAADLLAGVLVGSLLLAWLQRTSHRVRPLRLLELAGVLGFIGAIGWMIFAHHAATGLGRAPITFLVFPGLVWAAFRFGQRGASAASLILWTIALFGTASGQGPFAIASPVDAMLITQGYIVVLAITGLAVGGEVTRRRISERRLEQSEFRYRTLIAHSPEAICVIEAASGRLVDANAAAESLFLLGRESLLQADLGQLSAAVQPGGRSAEETIGALIAGAVEGKLQRFEWLHRRADGSTIPCEMRLIGLPGRQPLVRASIVDLSDRPFFAQVTVLESLVRGVPLDDALTQLAALLEAQMPEGRAVMFGCSTSANAFEVLAAPSFPPEFIGTAIPHAPLAVGRYAARGGGVAHEIPDVFEAPGWERVRPLAARWGFRALWVWPCFDAEGGILGAVAMQFAQRARPNPGQRALLGMAASLAGLAMQRDQAERSLRATETQLRQAQKMDAVGRLAGGVAHDFNNLLTVIGAATELLAENPEADVGALEEVKMIREATERATGLTRQLLAFSRQQPWQPTRIDLNIAIRRIEAMLRRVVGPNQAIVLDLGTGLKPTIADETQIQQVLLNLCVNARDAMPYGGAIRIATRGGVEPGQSAAVGPRDWITLEVRDEGDGIPAGLETRIFEPFFTTKPAGAGTGLGLATVYGIVQQAGGTIVATNGPHGGAIFTVTMPAAAGEVEMPLAAEPGTLQGGSGERILLVEDEPTLRRLTVRVLRRAGYVVEDAPDAEVAIRRLREGLAVDLVLTDVVMPGRSGAELGREIAEMNGPPVLYTSGYTEDTILLRQIREDGLPFLPKPFTVDKLLASVRASLSSVA